MKRKSFPNSCPEPPVTAPTSETGIIPRFSALPGEVLKKSRDQKKKMKDELVHLFDEKEIYTNGT